MCLPVGRAICMNYEVFVIDIIVLGISLELAKGKGSRRREVAVTQFKIRHLELKRMKCIMRHGYIDVKRPPLSMPLEFALNGKSFHKDSRIY